MKKIKGYKDFLNTLIFESIIFATNDFMQFLYELSHKNTPIKSKAGQLYNKINSFDVKTNINYIGLSPNSNNEISFIPDSQFQRYYSDGVNIQNKSKSYSNVGRAFRQLLISFEIPFNDKDIEIFANEYKAYWDSIYSNRKFEIVKGDEILKWYLESNYTEKKSTLGNSCMRFEERNHFMKLYAENPDTISMCIVKEGDKISARALIWNLENGKTYLERIYYTEDSLISFVTDNVAKLYPKELYSYNAGAPTGMVVNLKKVDFEKYPYADIMCFVHQKIVDGKIEGTGKISNSNRLELEGEWRVISIQSTSGDPSDLTHKKSKSLDIYIKNEEAVYLSELDDYFRKSDLNYSNYLRSYLTKENSVYSEDIKDYIPKKEAIKHPKFGLVPKNKIFNVFDGYKVKEEPISIYNKFQSKNYSGLKLTEKLILEDSDYFNFFDILFTKNNVIQDIESEYIPKIICERIVRIDDDVKNSLKKDGLECLLIYDNILEIDAIALGIEYSNIRYADPVHTVIRVMENYGRIPYLNYINNIKNEKIKKERQLKFEAYDNYLKSNKSWIFNSGFKKEEIMDLFIETFNNAIEFGSSEKIFTWIGSENLDFYEFFKKCSYDIYESYFNNIEESKKELLFSLYKRLMALYYLTMDSYDSKGYFRDNIENKELEILNGIVLSGDNGLEICREVVKTSHRQIFTLIQQSFDVLKDMDDSIDNLDIQDIRQFLRKEFYKHSNYELFKKLNDIV